MIHIGGIKIEYKAVCKAKESGAEELKSLLEARVARVLGTDASKILRLRILRESIDARKKPDIFFQYAVALEVAKEEALLQRILGKTDKGRWKGGPKGEDSKILYRGLEISRGEPLEYHFPAAGSRRLEHPILIAGAGPAGLFCGYFLALHGYRPVILERGKAVEDRQRDVQHFWETGELLPDSNVQFGEGGAGAFSDGKLNTLVKDKDGRNREVLRVLAECGAGEEICYEAKPHIGTDVLCLVVRNMRERIIRHGGEVRFESQVTDVVFEQGEVRGVYVNGEEFLPCEKLVLAVGHSARDTFQMLYDRQVPMEPKAFAVGLRVEHTQEMINLSQYGLADPAQLGAAPYKVTAKADNGRGVYSFCMCPGGYVVNASSEEGHLAVNGMSYSGRGGRNANSAVIVSVTPADFGSEHPLAGIAFQRSLEKKAYDLAAGKIPMQRYGVFKTCVEQRKTQEELGITVDGATGMPGMSDMPGMPQSGCREKNADAGTQEETDKGAGISSLERVSPEQKGQHAWADVSRILPRECNEAFVQGMTSFARQIKGFDREDAILSGVESRTSSPVRIPRDATMQAVMRGLYPCGEGAGYAGGITSAAMDGLRTAEAIAAECAPAECASVECVPVERA